MTPLYVNDVRESRRSTSRTLLIAVGLGLTVLLALVAATSARAYEISNFSANIVKQNGTDFENQAGGHPYQGIITFDTKITPSSDPTVSPVTEQGGATKTIRVDTPPGLVPNPEAVPKCAQANLEANTCPPASQIGTVVLRLRSFLPAAVPVPQGTKGTLRVTIGLYNMEAKEGQLARFSFNPTQAPGATGHTVDIEGAMRPTDNGLYFTINNVATPTTAEPLTPLLTGSTLTFWGAPGAASHDADRGKAQVAVVASDVATLPSPPYPPGTPLPLPILLPARPATGALGITNTTAAFLNSPTTCNGPQPAKLTLDSYQGAEDTDTYLVGAGTPGLEGCDKLPFSQTTTFGPSSVQNDAPSPLGVTLDVPQTDDINTLATAHVKRVAVTLPPGMTISPSAANGLEACTDAQFAQGTNDPIDCSAASKIGVVSIKSPALADPLEGAVYVGQPLAGNRYRLFVNADGYGISIRLKGTVTPDPVTGQITAVFDDNPQLPFSQFKLDFDGGSKAIIATPQTCGVVTGSSSLTPWSGEAASTSAPALSVTGCNGFPFSPGFGVSLTSLQSGAYSPLTVGFSRADGNQYLSGLSATLPPGMLAKLKGVTQCSEAQVAAEACPDAARIGTTSVTAGPGSAPYALSGPVYLTGGYNGGSFGTVAVIHVVAGPYDLGNVVVRQALRIDPNTAQVTVDSDPLPQIKEGIVLRLRQLNLSIDRAGFMRNPTSCSTGQLATTLTSAGGAVAHPTGALAFTGCKDLGFAPKVTLAFKNKSQMGKFKHPRLTAVVTQTEGQAGIKSSSVALPKAVALAADNAQGLCETADALKDACPKASIVGSATAETPILNKTLSGPVYFVKGVRKDPKTGAEIKTLPALFIPLRGETTIFLRAQTGVSHDRLVTTFPAIPDAPITKFTLNIDGGKHGIIASTRNLCLAGSKFTGSARFGGQNGKVAPTAKPRITTACGKAVKKPTKKK